MRIYIDLLKTFCSKYKRYFGALGLFILLIIVLAGFAGPQDVENTELVKGPDTQSTEDNTSQAEQELEGEFTEEADEELDDLIHSYYEAYVSGAVETLETLASPITDNEKSYIMTFSQYYEEYRDIECFYVKEEGNRYFVSSCYELKFKDIDTPAAGMDFFYVERDGKGNLYINNAYSAYNFNFMETELDANVYSKILSYEQRPEVIKLQQEVQAKYEAAITGDEKLAAFVGGTLRNVIAQWRESIEAGENVDGPGGDTEALEPENSESSQTPEENDSENNGEAGNNGEDGNDGEGGNNGEDGNDGDGGNEDEEPEVTTYTVKTLANCNIRAEATTDSAVIGQVRRGAKLTAVGEEANWIKLDFHGETGYIREDLVKKTK